VTPPQPTGQAASAAATEQQRATTTPATVSSAPPTTETIPLPAAQAPAAQAPTPPAADAKPVTKAPADTPPTPTLAVPQNVSTEPRVVPFGWGGPARPPDARDRIQDLQKLLESNQNNLVRQQADKILADPSLQAFHAEATLYRGVAAVRAGEIAAGGADLAAVESQITALNTPAANYDRYLLHSHQVIVKVNQRDMAGARTQLEQAANIAPDVRPALESAIRGAP
jgi:hypothetical protein